MLHVSVCCLYCLSLSVTLPFWWINMFILLHHRHIKNVYWRAACWYKALKVPGSRHDKHWGVQCVYFGPFTRMDLERGGDCPQKNFCVKMACSDALWAVWRRTVLKLIRLQQKVANPVSVREEGLEGAEKMNVFWLTRSSFVVFLSGYIKT